MAGSHSKQWTRRRFLSMVGQAGGSAALYETMTALGLVNVPAAWAGPPTLQAGPRRSVIVLGSGISGLTCAYLLRKAGCKVRILEANDRPGGRSLTARRGTVIEEYSAENGSTRQVCDFDEGLYANMGPGRIPHHHVRVLHYCRELGVPLEVFVMRNAATLFQTGSAFGGEPQQRRRLAYDTQGFIAELLAKAVNQNALDEALNFEDRDRLLDLLQNFGALGGTEYRSFGCSIDAYCGSTRAGVLADPDVRQGLYPVPPPFDLAELLRSEFWRKGFYGPDEFDWQGTLFQPVGGMDQLVQGFLRVLGNRVWYQSPVKAISVGADRVQVTFQDLQTGRMQRISADACVSSIPLPLLRDIIADPDSNVSDSFRDAVGQMEFSPSCKIAWQANRRFWELENRIYGGISWIDHPITQMWYPSNDYQSERGTVVGAYTFGAVAAAMGELSLADRLALGREGAAKLHPEFADELQVPEALGLSIAWRNAPFQAGAFPEWEDTPAKRQAYERLLAPDRGDNPRLWVVGDQVCSLGAWQEGAVMSAEWVAQQVTGAIPASAPEVYRAPQARHMLGGAT